MLANFILYVRDQEASMRFYKEALALEPTLHVPGMTEFTLRTGCVLGLMPEKGIERLLGDKISVGSKDHSRAELYLTVEDPAAALARAIKSGARLLSSLEPRNWGDDAGYVMDPDGHILVFARKSRA